MVKKNKDKYEILVRNCKGKRETTTIKISKIPYERCYIREVIKDGLKVKWNKDGSKIEKAKFKPEKVDIEKIKDRVKLELQEIKD
jgi:hypothetical protein